MNKFHDFYSQLPSFFTCHGRADQRGFLDTAHTLSKLTQSLQVLSR